MLKLITDRNEEGGHAAAIDQLPGVVLVDCQAADSEALQGTAMLDRLEATLEQLESDANCTLLVFQGLGLPAHGAGAPDIRLYRRREALLKRYRELAPLAVALIDGACSGLHLEIMLGADVCIASDGSSFAVPEPAQGRLPGMSIFRLASQIGLRHARQLVLLNGVLSARDALAQGLLDTVCPASEFAQHVAGLAGRLSPQGLVATQLSRRLLEESFSVSYEDSLGHFLAAQHRCYARLADPVR